MTLKDKHAYYSTDFAEFSAEVYVPSDTKAPFSFFQIKHDDSDKSKPTTSAMLNHQGGALRWYTGGHTFMGSMKGKWIPFTVTHNGPTKDITVNVDGQKKGFKARSSTKKFHFKFGPYAKQERNNKHEKFEAKYRNIKVKINKKKVF